MPFWKNDNREEIDSLKQEIKELEKSRRQLKEEVSDLKLSKKIEDEDIKHMIRINEEKNEVILEKHKLELEREQATAIANVKDEYQNKTEKQLEKQVSDMKSMYSEILARLPQWSHSIKEKRE